jgi:hypothetical protein
MFQHQHCDRIINDFSTVITTMLAMISLTGGEVATTLETKVLAAISCLFFIAWSPPGEAPVADKNRTGRPHPPHPQR